MGGDITLLSNYVSPDGDDKVPLNDIERLLALVCCSKHVAGYKGSLGGLLIATDHDNLRHTAGSPLPMLPFGSQKHANVDYAFSFSISSQTSEPPTVDPSDVSITRRLRIFSGGRKEVHKVDAEATSSVPPLAVSSPVDLGKALFDTPPRSKPWDAGNPSTPPARLSLSPNEARRANRNRSETRARTPSPGHSRRFSDYGRLAWATMRGDVSYESPPARNQKKVLDIIRTPLRYNDARTWNRPGSVYVVRDPELDLVKIGFTTDCISARVRRMGNQCRASCQQWQIEHEASNVPILAYRRLERLVHADLAPHRWFFLCECGSTKSNASRLTEHQEWFDVSPEIAIKTIKLWRRFLLQGPYGAPLQYTDMPLKGPWIDRTNKYKEAGRNEKHEDHETRLGRWRQLFGIEDPHEPTRVPNQEGMEASKTKIKSEPVEEDQATIFMEVPQKAPKDSPIPSTEPATVAVPPTSASSIFVDPDDGNQTPKFRGHTAPPPTTPSSGEATPPALASAEDQPKAEMQYEDSKQDHISPHNLDATSKAVHHGEKLLVTLLAALNHKRPAVPERTIVEDLAALRWPLGCAVVFALHAPYVPPLLSAMLWTIFLPSLVAELRGWTL